MRLPRISLTALLTLVATLTISDVPLIDNLKFKTHTYQALAQTLDTRKASAEQLLDQGTKLFQASQLEAALQSWQQALTIYREIGDRAGEGQALHNLGRTLLQSGNLAPAEKTLIDSIQVWESLRTQLGGKNANNVSIFETQAQSYRNLQQALVAQNRNDAALEIAERGRARAFVELLESRLPSNGRAQHLPTRQMAISPPTIEQIKQIAKEHNATLVEYSIISDNFQVSGKQQTQESDLFIWVIQPTGEVTLRRVDLKPLWQKQNTSLTDLVANTRKAIGLSGDSSVSQVEKRQTKGSQIQILKTPNRLAVPSQEVRQTKELQQLYQLLIQPIADLLPKDPSARVVFIPQGSLFLVPFAALQDASGKYLIEQHSILTAPAIQVLALTRQQRQRLGSGQLGVGSGEFLVVGNPTMPSLPAKPGERPQQLASLPGAEQEAKAIAALLNTQAITGNQATKVAILQKMPRARIIHLATSGIVDQMRGIRSAIALAPDPSVSGTPPDQGGDRAGNGFLTAEEIFDMKLNAELVVLSGCDTGLGTITGDGVIGLSRSFIAAGVPSVIVSLGYVSDEATALLMTEFYRILSSTPDKAQALRQAMLTTMKKYPNPIDWGAFTLIGEAE
ncbi:MAG TPA: CHAT domain-containing tetratricopeptide repeat protein [Coleofasciculaceae cyanobacterium]|jgi:CHAT domain-containing protein